MAKPTTRDELKEYCLRQLGAPVLEINVADEQIDDLLDDTLQYFNERHFDGVEKTFLKYQITQDDIDRGRGSGSGSVGVTTTGVGIVTTTGTSTNVSGLGTVTSNFYETSNFIQVPDSVIGIEKVFKFDTSSISGGMFSIKYQLFLNDLYFFNSVDLLTYRMTKSYLEDIDMLLTTDKQIRFNQRQNRLYLDIDWDAQEANNFLVIECYRALDPTTYTQVYNDPFLKKYLTALIKKQWGTNLTKYTGVQLPGGLTLNGEKIYTEAISEVEKIESEILSTYAIPPLDLIG